MPPKKAITKEDTVTSDGNVREGRLKRTHAQRDTQEEPAPPAQIVPFDIGSLDDDCLQKYRKVMHIPTSSRAQDEDDSKAPSRYMRVKKSEELRAAARRHWNSAPCKETEIITSFLYTIRNQEKTFKLRFVDSSRN